MATKKNKDDRILPLPENIKAEADALLRQNNIPVPGDVPVQKAAPTSNATNITPESQNIKSNIIRDETTGKLSGITLPDGRTLIGLSAKDIAFLSKKYYGVSPVLSDKELKLQNQTPAEVPEAVPEDLSGNIGQFNPEQQLLAGGSVETPGSVNLVQALKQAGEKGLLSGSAAATSGAGIALGVTAATGGAAAPSIPVTAGLAGAGGFVYGSIKSLFNAYDKKNEFNYNFVAKNIDMAQANMQKAIVLAGSGAGDDAKLLALEEYNNALAQLTLAERQLKELSKNTNSYVSNVREKQTELEYFNQNVRPILDTNFRTALRR